MAKQQIFLSELAFGEANADSECHSLARTYLANQLVNKVCTIIA
jgi:hypothetical protein